MEEANPDENFPPAFFPVALIGPVSWDPRVVDSLLVVGMICNAAYPTVSTAHPSLFR
jgi:hypothetical protein